VSDESPASPPDLEPDGVAVALGGGPCDVPGGYAAFKGFLAGPDACNRHRIYLDNSLWRWLEIRAADIKLRQDVPANETDPRSTFFVPRTATVVLCRADEAHVIEQEVLRQRDDSAAYTHPPW
jgi:hypothetical protein